MFDSFGGMKETTEKTSNAAFVAFALQLFLKAVILAAQWAGGKRQRALADLARADETDKDKEILLLRERIGQLEEQVAILQKHNMQKKPRFTLREQLLVLWHMAYFQIPRRHVTHYFGIARSTFYRWLRRLDLAPAAHRVPANKTPAEIAAYGLQPVLPARRTVEVLAFCSWSACRMNNSSSAFACSGSTS